MKIPTLIFSMVALLTASPGYSQSAAEAFDQLMDSFTSMSGSFVQTIYAESGEVIDIQQGTMSLQKPRRIRWETAQPRQLMVCDGDSIYHYEPDLEQVVIRSWRDDPTQNPLSLFTAGMDLSEWFEITREVNSFKLLPRQPDSLIGAIQVFVDADGRPAGFTVSDQPGQLTRVDFEDISFDGDLADAIFIFVPPQGVDVIVDD